MLRIFPETNDDFIDVQALPSTENTELNYRPRPLTAEQELRLTLLLLLGTVPVALLLAVPTYILTQSAAWIDDLVFSAGPSLLVWFAIRRLAGAVVRWEILLGLIFFASSTTSVLWGWAMSLGEWSGAVALISTWITSSLIGRQFAAWIVVAPTVSHKKMKRWQINLPRLVPHGRSLDCPELLTYSVSPILLAIAWLAATHLAGGSHLDAWAWPLYFAGSVHVVWGVWHAIASPFLPWPDLRRSWQLTLQAIGVFSTYNLHNTPAAGVFRFPTRWLRSPWHRWGLLMLALILIAFSFGVNCPNPFVLVREQGLFLGPLVLNLIVISLAAPLVLLCSLWLTVGTLLARFDRELSHFEHEGLTEWDNYIDRIINSEDELEREHMLLGTCESGDYPILVHSEIHDQHAHILGDSGASKTALGIAPQVTQKIARGDSTVVVIDLKGDRALFETCRREAARTRKLRFRWLSNEVGKTTYGFNPFLQSHNAKMTVEQLSQQLLQGLSLDYGIHYGAGYFTAMNETVLNGVLRETGARSFLELSERLSDRRWYAGIGYEDDWKQARHLSALVKRLGSSAALNLVPGMYPDQPAVHEQAIDVTNVIQEPQVLYLSLRSPIEPTNAPAMARLFLWSIFTAAGHQPHDGNRVYLFVDEMQQIISDGIKLIFEQFRDLGGTIIAAHQTAGQLRRQGTDLGDTIDSCTAMKQVFRASDLDSLDRLEKLSGTKTRQSPTWYQTYERGTGELTERYDPLLAREGMVRVTEQDGSRYDRNELMAISSRRQSSLVRFTFGSGYTQFAGATIPVVSRYHISFDEYKQRRQQPWPTAPGAFTIEPPAKQGRPDTQVDPKPTGSGPDRQEQDRNKQVESKFLKASKQRKKKTSQPKRRRGQGGDAK